MLKRIAEIICKGIENLVFALGLEKLASVLGKHVVHRYYNENNSNMWKNGELNFVERNKEKLSVVFDVGSYVGNWSMAILKIKSDVSIHCFEPVGFVFEELLNNASQLATRN